MKKLFVFAALAAPLFFFSCAKEMEPVQEPEQAAEEAHVAKIAFKASIESLNSPTKADINASNQLVWAAGDKIGVFVNDGEWVDKNQSFVLVGAGGSTNGSFEWDVEPAQDFTNTNATAAFFPWQGKGSTYNNVYDGTLYYKLPQGYYEYTSGKMLTPLVAKITRTGEEYDNLQFYHAGSAVKVKINNLPAGAKSIGLSVDGKQIRGDWHVNPANAGTDAMALDDAENTSLNDVWLNFEPSGSEREFTFLFPVPTLPASSKLNFVIYDKNDVKVWAAGAKTAGDVALARGNVLAMPALSITAYSEFDQKSAWGICGTHNGWAGDTPMVCEVEGDVHIANDITFEANAEFKIRKNGDWAQGEYGWSNIDGTDGLEEASGNIKVLNAGTYDVILNTSTHKIKVVASDIDYPDAGTMPHHTSIKKATNLGATETANCYVVKAAGKYKFPGVKGNSATTVGDIKGVELLWETYNTTTSVTANSVIEAIDYDETDNFVYFKTPDVLQPGNALIAAKDGSDNIIWSWHIWIPASTITDIEEYSVSKNYLMDRNLGAIVPAVEPVGDGTVDLRSVGLYYQWGRKDPFVGYKFGKVEVEPSISGASGRNMLTTTTKVTVDESIAIPTTFVKGTSTELDGDWLSSTDNTLWGQGSSKTIYDPCPAGYRVPNYDSSDNLWKQVTGLANFSSSTASAGHWWKLGSAVFPYAGCYDYTGSISHPYDRCWLWSAKANGTADYGEAQYVYDNSGTWASQPGWGKRKSCGAVVRCVRIDGEVLPPIPAGAAGVTLDTGGNISSDWSKAEAFSESGSIKEWKYGYDASNLYFYFKISRSAIIAASSAPYIYDNRRYIYIALDTDNDPSDAEKPDYGDMTITGCEAIALVHPFRGTALTASGTDGTLEIVNGVDEIGWTRTPITGSRTGKHLTAYGNVQADYVYVEVSLPRDGIGSPANGIYRVQFSLSSNLTGISRIEIK